MNHKHDENFHPGIGATQELSLRVSVATLVRVLENLMIRELPGIFCAGEMLDWEAPTGGYLLTACFASGRVAGLCVMKWMET